MLSALALLACPNLAVPPQLMYHVAMVESRASPFAIGVVGGRLARQPLDLAEAIATARMLEAGGYKFSVGIAQVNRANLARYGLDTWERAFDVCPNLRAGSQILARCYGGAGGAWDKAFSCYYSGDHATGIRDGYVQKIFASLGAGAQMAPIPEAEVPIRLVPASKPRSTRAGAGDPITSGGAARRIAIRTAALEVPVDMVGGHAGPVALGSTAQADALTVQIVPGATGSLPEAVPQATGAPVGTQSASTPDNTAFVPHVSRPGASRGAAAPGSTSVTAPAVAGDPADPRQRHEDSAFVF